MRRLVLSFAAVVLLAGPTALAFFSGGYFDEPRLWAACITWLLVAAVAVLSPRPLPSTRPGRIALAGLAALTVWTALSMTWAPVVGPALDAAQRLALYLAALVAGAALLREPRIARALEPALGLGAAVVICEGLSDRLLPGLFTLEHSRNAAGRLNQPITYWNAEGLLAAVGLVLCARIAGDRTRPVALRAVAAAAAAPLGAGVYLSFSRGAIVAAVLGLLILSAVTPTWTQLRGIGLALIAALPAAATAALAPGVASLAGTPSVRERQGAVVLAVFLVAMAVAVVATLWVARGERAGRLRERTLPGARRLPALVAGIVVLGSLALVVASSQERGDARRLPGDASRLTSVKSNRHEYWRVAVNTFVDNPVRGVGAGGFRVEWLRERKILEGVLDTHSLELEVAAELGLVGLLALGLMFGGVAGAARTALRRRPALVAGPIAGASTWLVHASIDWDWQLPAVSLPAVLLAAGIIAAAEPEGDEEASVEREELSGEALAPPADRDGGSAPLPAAPGLDPPVAQR